MSLGTGCKYHSAYLGGCCASARAAARGNALANAEELRGIGFTQESTSEIGGEDIVLSQRRSIIQIWQSWSQRMRQRYNAALQQWPTVSELVSIAAELRTLGLRMWFIYFLMSICILWNVRLVQVIWTHFLQILPSVKEALLLVLRAHLMLFYFEGIITQRIYFYFCELLGAVIAYWVLVVHAVVLQF